MPDIVYYRTRDWRGEFVTIPVNRSAIIAILPPWDEPTVVLQGGIKFKCVERLAEATSIWERGK